MVVGLAVTRPGYPTEAVDLNDSSVWVTNLAAGQRKVARYNAPIEELTGGFALSEESGQFDVVQTGRNVVIAEATDFRVIDPAALKLGEPTQYPQQEYPQQDGEAASEGAPGRGRVAVGGAAALVVSADGQRAWLRPFESLGGIDKAAGQPDIDLADGAAEGAGASPGAAKGCVSGGSEGGGKGQGCPGSIVMAPDGSVFAVAGDGRVARVWLGPAGSAGRVRTRELGRIGLAAGGAAAPNGGQLGETRISAVTAVGDRVYALVGTTLAWDGGEVDLGAFGAAEELKLQAPAASGTKVAVAAPQGLLLIGTNGQVDEWRTGNRGEPAVPASVGDCVHAAWAASPERGDNYAVSCGGRKTASRALEALTEGSRIVFRVNRQTIILNDVQDGRIWMPAQDSRVRDALNWDQIDPKPADAAGSTAGATGAAQVDCDDQAAKPQAQDDELGARPATSTVLMVLGNDAATGCGALAIDRIDGLDPASGHAEPVLSGRAVQFTPAAGVTAARFTYTVSDAGGQTDSANVAITVSDTANAPPRAPDQPPELAMELGATATHRALAGFTDPDGDPLALLAATSNDPDLGVSHRPDGMLTIKAVGGSPRRAVITLTVADSRGAVASPAELRVDLRSAGTLAPAADAVKADTAVGQTVSLPLRDFLRTHHAVAPVFALDVQSDPLTQVGLDSATGQLSFSAQAANTYLLDVRVAAGANTGRLSVRIDVREAGTSALVAVQDTVYVRPGRPALVDPLANDLIPEAAVPVLQDFELPDGARVAAVPLGHQYLEVSDSGGGGAEDVVYTVAAGGATASGVIRVVHAEAGAGQDPIVTPKTVTVRAGGVVTIPALEQAFDPDGDALSVAAGRPIEPSPSCGTVYVSARSVRYQAPEEPCPKPVAVAVPVVDDSGGSALGLFTVEVHESRGGSKPPPTPLDLTARVLQGQEVTIPVPLTGIDVDGDGVALQQGLDVYPRSGSVTEIGPDYIKYRAGADQPPGTDTFTYAVEDWAANRATASVTVGVAAPGAGATGVVARDDKAAARPGKVLEIPVLVNDVDLASQDPLKFCDGQELGLSSALVQARADLSTGRIEVALPEEPGQYQVVYHACGAGGNRDSAAVNLTVDPAAPPAPPRAKDIVSPPQETIDKVSVDIDVLRTAYNPSGPTSDLELFLPDGSGTHAALKSAQEITVNLQQDLPTIVFYGLRNGAAEADGATAYGSITVPPIARPPYLRPGIAPIRAEAGRETIVNLDEFVAVARGREGAFLFDPAGSPAAGGVGDGPAGAGLTAAHGRAVPAKGGRAIAYTPDRDHAGPDRIEFWVADGPGPSKTADANGAPDAGGTLDGDAASEPGLKTSRLWLDVSVGAPGRSQLTFQDPAPQVERGGGSRTVDLADFLRVDGQAPPNRSKVAAEVGPVSLQGVRVRRAETVLTIEVGPEAAVGDRATVPLTLAYADGPAQAGFALTVTVVETRQPAVKPNVPGEVKAVRGEPVTVPVLAGVFDPWAKERPARLEAVAVVGDASAGAAGQSITVTPHSAGGPSGRGAVAVSFAVVDAVGRRQSGSFTVIVRDRPDPPAVVTAVTSGRGEAQVSWAPVVGAAAGGEPVESYRVTLAGALCDDASRGATSSRCLMNDLALGAQYRVEVRARNAVGESDRPGIGLLDYDLAPDPPVAGQALAGKNRIDLSWSPPPASGGTVDHYAVACNGTAVDVDVRSTSVTVGGLRAGAVHICSVAAVGRKGASVAAGFGPVTPYGEPEAPGAPRVVWAGAAAVSVAWDPVPQTGADVHYELLVDGRPQAGCGAFDCMVGLNPGDAATFQVKAVSERADAGWKTSEPTGPLRQSPASVETLPVPVLTPSVASPAGAAWVEVAWPAAPVQAGFEAVGSWWFDGGRISAPNGRFEGLTAGVHTARAVYCLSSGGGVPLVPGSPADGLCAESLEARVEVATLPGPPRDCSSQRVDRWTVAVWCANPSDLGGLPASWRASVNGGAARAQGSGMFEVDAPGGAAAGGQVEVWLVNDLGRSPRIAIDYPAWQGGPSPGSSEDAVAGPDAIAGPEMGAGPETSVGRDAGASRTVNVNRRT
jgi:hypothetical protein